MDSINKLKAEIIALSNWCEDHCRTEMGWDVKYQSLIDKRHELSALKNKKEPTETALPISISNLLNQTQEHVINTFK